MSRPLIAICDLKPEHNIWKLDIHVVNLLIIKEHSGQQHLEVIIQDAKADQIQIVTRSRELEIWNKFLQENQTYTVYNGEPLINDLPLKVCDNKFKLFSVVLQPLHPLTFLKYHIILTRSSPFQDFLNGNFVVDRLDHVIGVVHNVARTQVTGVGKKACCTPSSIQNWSPEPSSNNTPSKRLSIDESSHEQRQY
ncbi:hypothetical protein RYX36_031022 [Vicia faba]